MARLALPLMALYLLATPLAYAVAARSPGHRFAPYLALHAVLSILAIAVWRGLRRSPRHGLVRAVVVTGLLARFALVPVAAFTTTDVSRYLWDGAVAHSRHDPYLLAPASPQLAELARVFPPPTDHTDIPTCYPPLAIGLFAVCATAGPRGAFVAWKLVVALASGLALIALWRHLRETDRAADVALLALSPLVLLEGGVGGHLDVVAALAVLLAVLGAERGWWRAAAVAVGVAAALKIVPGVVALALVVRAPRRIGFSVWCAIPVVVSVGVALVFGISPLGSLPLVARSWSFGSPLWAVLTWLTPEREDEVRLLLALAGLIALGVLARRPGSIATAVRNALGASLAMNPTLYPWYGVSLATITPLAPSAWSLVLLTVLPTSYEVLDAFQARSVWRPSIWPVAIVGVAVCVALVAGMRRRCESVPPGAT